MTQPQVLLLQPDPARLSFLTRLLEENGRSFLVQNAMTQCGGTAYLYEVLDHKSDAIPRRRVAGELILEVPQA